ANNLGFGLIRAGRFTDAWQVLEPALARFPDRPALMKNAGLALLRLDQADTALRLVDRALRLAPEYGPAWGVRAQVRAAKGDREGARQDFAAFARLTPDTAEVGVVRRELENAAVFTSTSPPPAPAPPATPGGRMTIPLPSGFPFRNQVPGPEVFGAFEKRFESTGDLVIAAVILQKEGVADSCVRIGSDLEPAVFRLRVGSYRALAKRRARQLLVTFRNHAGQ